VNSSGQQVNYFPYAEERTSTTEGMEKFATYFRDGGGVDYADQRYYSSVSGRFNGPDSSGHPSHTDPTSWNRYAYVQGDPINFFDPTGQNQADPNDPSGLGYTVTWGFLTGYGPEGPYTYVGAVLSGGANSQVGPGGGLVPDAGKKFYVAASTLWKALDVAMTKLDSYLCRVLFGNSSSPDPRAVLQGLLYGTSKYGMVTVNDIPDQAGKVTSATTVVTGLTSVDIENGKQLVNGQVLITINDLAGDFVNGDVNESAATLLHELGHTYFDLDRLLGGSVILPDGGNVAASQENQQLIKKYCF